MIRLKNTAIKKLRLNVSGYSQGKYLYTLSNQVLLMLY